MLNSYEGRLPLNRSVSTPALLVISHLRWDFVFQRPQHLMTRAARTRRVYYIEEPILTGEADHLSARLEPCGVTVVTPLLTRDRGLEEHQAATAQLLADFVLAEGLEEYDLWVYSPMELPITAGLMPRVTVYDCMDELANFRGAPPELRRREDALFGQADVVFTGGHRLYEAKRRQHQRVHPFPSSVDVPHFTQARDGLPDPADQRELPRPRLGFYGVIDERFDIGLIGELARRRPEWQLVLLGPVVKIDPADLPRGDNLHYLGMKSYAELPAYLAHWDVALLPFALNEATEFISPTKTPEYLAAGVPVVSTPIRDVVRPYGERELVRIADGVDAFEAACAAAIADRGTSAGEARRERADRYLSTLSWDRTWADMSALIERAAAEQAVTALAGVADD